MSVQSTIDGLKQGAEIFQNPAKALEALKDPSKFGDLGLLPKAGVGGSLQELGAQVASGIEKLPTAMQDLEAGIAKLSTSNESTNPDSSSTLGGSISMVDADGKKINLEQAVEGISLILGAFAKLFGKDTADQEASDEFDVDTNPSSLDQAIISGDSQAIRREARGYFEHHPENGAAGFGLLGNPAKVTYENGKKMTWCAQSARIFAEQFFKVNIPKVENAYKAERELYNAGQKLSPEGALALQKEKPGTIFHVFFDRPRDKGLTNPLGHAAIAYVDKWGTLRVYDPYLAPTGSAKGNARSEAYPLSQHQRIASARLYPVSYDITKMPPSVAPMVNTDGKNAPLVAQNVHTRRDGAFEKHGKFDKIKSEYGALIDKYAARYGAPSDVVIQLIAGESGGDPTARPKTAGATAYGLGQIIDETWGAFQKAVGNRDRHNPEHQIEGCIWYLAEMKRLKNCDWQTACIYYHTGPGATDAQVPTYMKWNDGIAQRMRGQPQTMENYMNAAHSYYFPTSA